MSPAVQNTTIPIAVVGMGCRFPGSATSPEAFWKMLVDGESAWSQIPNDRVNLSAFYHPDASRPGSISFRGGHFLKDNVAVFDSAFFSVSAEEAKAMDPQQRMLLEITVEALDNAGVDRNSLRKTETGVWIGSFVKDYEQIVFRDHDTSPIYGATGNGTAILSNRISFFLDINGPSMTIDTGCSASLVALHQGCQSLCSGEVDMALAGGVGMILTPDTMMPMDSLNFLSPDGRCWTFDARANGYGRGEGIGVVVLKRLDDAIRDNDTIRAVIRGSRVNQDGRTPGITLPNPQAQLKNMEAVYVRAGLDPSTTTYVECHGTGTPAGDTRELRAVSQCFGRGRTDKNPIFVGSVKANIGHLEGCAGIAGLMKAILTIKRGMIPKQINFQSPGNPEIPFKEWNIKVPIQSTTWPGDGIRRASLNCFGFGGTNAHAILDDAAHYLSERGLVAHHNTMLSKHLDSASTAAIKWHLCTFKTQAGPNCIAETKFEAPPRDNATHIVVFSAHEKQALSNMLRDVGDYLERSPKSTTGNMENLAYTFGCRRTHMPWRVSVVAKNTGELVKNLKKIEEDSFHRVEKRTQKLSLLFSGQGAQWFAMGRELLGFDVVLQSLTEASHYLSSRLGSSFILLEEILKSEYASRINDPEIAQPATTAVQVALVDLLIKYLHLDPMAVCGHSSGEIAAAYALGAITRESAWELSYFRGQCASASVEGRMLVVGLSRDAANDFIYPFRNDGIVVVACVNGPTSVTLSGDSDIIAQIQVKLEKSGIFSRLLAVRNPYHSPLMKGVGAKYLGSIAHIHPHPPRRQVFLHPHSLGRPVCAEDLVSNPEGNRGDAAVKSLFMFSTVTGKSISWNDLTPEYWVKNLLSPVEFASAAESMLQLCDSDGLDALIELSPHAALQAPMMQIMETVVKPDRRPFYLSMLKRHQDAALTALQTIGSLWERGFDIYMPWIISRNVSPQRPKLLVDLPTYPWNHDNKYWHESRVSLNGRLPSHGRYDLIGRPSGLTPFHPVWRGFIRIKENPWIRDHRVQGSILYPASGMLAMVIEGAKQIQVGSLSGIEITDFSIQKAIIVPETDDGLEYVLDMSPVDSTPDSRYRVCLHSKPSNRDWQMHAAALLTLHKTSSLSHVDETYCDIFREAQKRCEESMDSLQLYETLQVIGMDYGPMFRNLTTIKKSRNSCISVIKIPNTESSMPKDFEYPHTIHPATLDAVFQSAFAIESEPMVPTFVGRFYVSLVTAMLCGAGRELAVLAKASKGTGRDAITSFIVAEESWLTEKHLDELSEPAIVISDARFTRMATASDGDSGRYIPSHRNLCSEIIWQQVELLRSSEKGLKQKGHERILILTPEVMTPGLDRLVSELLNRFSCMTSTLEAVTGLEELPPVCVSLVDAGPEQSIWDWSDTEFSNFRFVVIKCSGCLWLTVETHLETSNPQPAMFHGLARTIRSENPLNLIVSLDINSRDLESTTSVHALVDDVARILEVSFVMPQEASDRETEYLRRDGELSVPRLTPLSPINAMIESGKEVPHPTTRLRSGFTYLLSGGLGGLGVVIAKLLLANGATHLAFISRAGVETKDSTRALAELRATGATIMVYKADICDLDTLISAMAAIREEMPPIKGVVQCAASLADGLFETMSFSDWQRVHRPKTIGSLNLYQCLATQEPEFFVFLSSLSGIVGNRGQANYAAGNTFQDALARHINHTAGKTRAISLDFGLILGAGMVATDQVLLGKLKEAGFIPIRLQDFKLVVEYSILGIIKGVEDEMTSLGGEAGTPPAQFSSSQIVIGVGTGGLMYQKKPFDPYWTRTTLFSILNTVDMPLGKMLRPPGHQTLATSLGNEGGLESIRGPLKASKSAEEKCNIVRDGFRTLLARMMNLPSLQDIDIGKCCRDYGVDSLSAVAIRNWVLEECRVEIGIFDVLGDSSIRELSDLVASKVN